MKSKRHNKAISLLFEIPYEQRSQILFAVTEPGFDFQTNEVGKILRDNLKGFIIQQAIHEAVNTCQYAFNPEIEFEIFLESATNYSMYVVALLLDFNVDDVQMFIKMKLSNDSKMGDIREFIDECREKFVNSDENGNRTVVTKESHGKKRAELVKLNVDMECRICFQNQISILYEPCYHFVACDECSSQLMSCPVCKAQIIRRKIFPGE